MSFLEDYFELGDRVLSVYNVGVVQKDLSRPTDAILIVCKSKIVIVSNYLKDENSTLVDLIASPQSRNFHKGKWFLSYEDFLKPFKETVFGNKYRGNMDQIYQTWTYYYEEMTEIIGKNYITFSVAIELWTISRHPLFVVFHIKDKLNAMIMIIQAWVACENPQNQLEKMKKKSLLQGNFVASIKENHAILLSKKRFELNTCTGVQAKLRTSWLSGTISNFGYLCALNQLAGRSLVSCSSYFIFPHVVTSVDQPLHSRGAALRKLEQPVGAHGLEGSHL